jgi:hypothetical protein
MRSRRGRTLSVCVLALLVVAVGAGQSFGETVKLGSGSLAFEAGITPKVLPRGEAAPIEVTIVAHGEGGEPVDLNGLTVDLDSHFSIRPKAAPVGAVVGWGSMLMLQPEIEPSAPKKIPVAVYYDGGFPRRAKLTIDARKSGGGRGGAVGSIGIRPSNNPQYPLGLTIETGFSLDGFQLTLGKGYVAASCPTGSLVIKTESLVLPEGRTAFGQEALRPCSPFSPRP